MALSFLPRYASFVKMSSRILTRICKFNPSSEKIISSDLEFFSPEWVMAAIWVENAKSAPGRLWHQRLQPSFWCSSRCLPLGGCVYRDGLAHSSTVLLAACMVV